MATQIKIKTEYGLQHLYVNTNLVALDGRITEVKQVSPGRWEGVAGGEPFTIIGGKAAGGAANEWFVQWAPGYGDQFIQANSCVEAANLIELC